MFNKAMTGGACQPDGQQSGLNQNPLTNMLENLIMGDARARQQAEGFINPVAQMNAQQMQMMEEQYAMMKNAELMSKQFDEMQINTSSRQTSPFFQQHQQVDLNSIWDSQSAQQIQYNSQQQFQQPWMNPMGMRYAQTGAPMYQPSQQMINETKQAMQAEVLEKPIEKETNVRDVTSNMVDVLQNSENPKHRNCKFLKFLNKLNHGAYVLENDQLVKNQVKLEEFKIQEVQRRAKDMLIDQIDQNLNTLEQNEEEEETKENFRNVLEDKDEEITVEKYNEMMKEWMQGGAEMENMNKLMEQWGQTWDEDYELKMPENKDVIKFALDNPYMQSDFNRVERAKMLIEDNKSQEAILCLEAEVQQNRENSEAWRILGQLFQENDQDNFAIIALKEAHNADPYDLDTLLALGVSCTNENDRTKAYEYLHLWLKYHPDFNHLPGVQETNDPEYDLIRRMFEEAHVMKPQDTQVLLALGVLSFIQTNFELAGAYFQKAVHENPTDHSLWNKYGAAFSQQLKSKEAIEAYQQALDLRPNYARCVINIGLAQNNAADYHASANSLLNGLLINPRLDHVRVYLKQAFLQMNRFDLVEKLELKDLSLFKNEFNLINPNNLPKPNLERLYSNPLFQQ